MNFQPKDQAKLSGLHGAIFSNTNKVVQAVTVLEDSSVITRQDHGGDMTYNITPANTYKRAYDVSERIQVIGVA